jgi:tetratricopeptide (TPR) repeat protein
MTNNTITQPEQSTTKSARRISPHSKLNLIILISTLVCTALGILACTQGQAAWFYEFKGENLKSFGQYTDALNCFNEQIAIEPKSAKAYFNKAESLYFLKRYPESIDAFTKAIALDPTHSRYFMERGVAYMQLGLDQKGIDDCTLSIALNPKDGNAYYNRALAYIKVGRRDLAEKDRAKVEQLGYKPVD